MTSASILRNAGGNDLVMLLSPIPSAGRVSARDSSPETYPFSSPPINSISIRDPFRERKRAVST